MGGLAHSFDIDNGKPRNPYGPGGSAGASPKNNSKLFFVICLIFVAVLGIRTILSSGSDPDDVWASKGDAAGGWGSEHHHTIVEHSAGSSSNGAPSQQQQQPNKPSSNTANEASPISDPPKPTNEASYYHEVMKTHKQKYTYGPDQELRMSDFYGELFDLVTVPTAHRPEYAEYQKPDRDYALAEKLLFDLNTPHGMAFDFVLNRDKRRLGPDDPHLVQRFVLALLFYATGGSDENDPKGYAEAHTGGNGGWDSGLAHFLTGLHECHWVKKSMEDQFWGLLSLEGDTDRRVGVTKCNADMEVTEIRLGMFVVLKFLFCGYVFSILSFYFVPIFSI